MHLQGDKTLSGSVAVRLANATSRGGLPSVVPFPAGRLGMARSGATAACAAILLCGCLGNGGGPAFTGEGTVSARIEDPAGGVLATANDAAAICTGSEPRTVEGVSAARISEIDGRGLFLAIGVAAEAEGGDASPHAMVDVLLEGVEPVEAGGVLPSWQVTSRSTLDLTQDDGLSGSAVFRDLEYGPGEPPDVEGGRLPQRISGSASWTCDVLERVPEP